MRQLILFETGFWIEKISNATALTLIKEYHYLGGISHTAQSFGAYVNGHLVGVVCFAVPVSENVRKSIFGEQYKNNVMELVRLCLHPECKIPASKIVSQSIKSFVEYRQRGGFGPIHGIISFADTNHGHHGGVYQSMSWMYIGTSEYVRNIYRDQTGRIRSSRQNGVEIHPSQAVELGWSHSKTKTIKHRYLKILGSKNQRKFFRARVRYTQLPYPKS